MVKEGTSRVVFYDGTVNTSSDFISIMTKDSVHPFIVAHKGSIVLVAWLTDLAPKSAHIHFFSFSGCARHSRYCAIELVTYLMAMKYEDDSFCFDVLIGMTPENNRRAFNFVLKSGFRHVGTIPLAAYIHDEDRSVDILVSAFTREDL